MSGEVGRPSSALGRLVDLELNERVQGGLGKENH